MKYNLDLERLSVQKYKDLLKQQNLLPGRRILWQDIDKNFAVFESKGIKSVADLKKSLSTPKRITAFATESGLSEEYLVILRREIGSLEQKPVPLLEFPGINASLLEKLAESGLRTSKEYWDQKPDISDELFCLCDLVRINGVGPVAARAFYEAGYHSASEVAAADAEDMLEKVSAVNEAHHYYKAKLGIKDMQFCIDFALLLNKYAF
ncbi:MAG: DUF4332 domain-containing protein [Candidatus Cloacimonetes bacterium]|nr:DUF4332 domain-containing protein [Candidatus Cloacimonadota bacterium]